MRKMKNNEKKKLKLKFKISKRFKQCTDMKKVKGKRKKMKT